VLKTELGRDPGADDFEESAGRHQFSVALSARRLDVVVVCGEACPRVTLHAATGDAVSPLLAVSASPREPTYGALFSVADPVPSNAGSAQRSWAVTNPDPGAFHVASLVDLQLTMALRVAPVLEVGQPATVTATVRQKDGTAYLGTLSVSGSLGSQGLTLDRGQDGDYAASVRIPPEAAAGVYAVRLVAAKTSTEYPLATASTSVKIGVFPHPVQARASADATRWPGRVSAVYSLPVLQGFAGWARGDAPLSPTARVTGTLTGRGAAAYPARPTVAAEVATRPGGPATAAVPAGAAGPGRYWLRLRAASSGEYGVTLHTGGPESFGETVTTPITVRVSVVDASAAQVAHAAAVTAALGMALLVLLLYVRFCLMRPPYGGLQEDDEEDTIPLARRRGPLEAFLRRSRLRSREPDVLEFKFGYLSGIRVRARGGEGGEWRLANGEELPRGFSHDDRLLGDGALYTVVDDEDLSWRHAASIVARALGLPVLVPRVVEEQAGQFGYAEFID
jgi:hypothetical protein